MEEMPDDEVMRSHLERQVSLILNISLDFNVVVYTLIELQDL